MRRPAAAQKAQDARRAARARLVRAFMATPNVLQALLRRSVREHKRVAALLIERDETGRNRK
jgi:hypothetical protein